MDLMSGYVLRALEKMPRQGDRAPWRLTQNYLSDLRMIRRGRIDDGVLAFDRTGDHDTRKSDAALHRV